MNIGMEVSSLITVMPSGIARYITETIAAMSPMFGRKDHLKLFYKMTRWRQKKRLRPLTGIPVHGYYKSLWPINKGIDIIHLPDTIKLNWPKAKCVLTIHDLLAIVMDDDDIAPQRFREKKREFYKHIIDHVDAIIAVSESTKKDICRVFNIPDKDIHVVHLGIDHQTGKNAACAAGSILEQYGLEPGYLFYLGGLSGRKNTERIVRAYAMSKASQDRPLVMAGPLSYKGERTLAAIDEMRVGSKVKLLGYVPDEHVSVLYKGASAFIFPTLYEGFGMPMLEAMSYGVPVLAGNKGSSMEVCAGHAQFVDPMDEGCIAEGIDLVLKTNSQSKELARSYSSKFTWARCAENTMDVYRTILNS